MRRIIVGIPLAVIMIVVSAVFVTSLHLGSHPKSPAAVVLSSVKRIPAQHLMYTTAKEVPVLVYHEMDNGCKATAVLCTPDDIESVSKRQFTAEMQWLSSNGYHTVTLVQYLAWLSNSSTRLPPKPFLITVDNGIGNFLTGAEPVLYHYRYTAAPFLITGFAAGAVGKCAPIMFGVNTQPGCPRVNYNWDLSWSQIKALSPAVYSFGMEAGTSGHYVQDYSATCTAFDACMEPGETGQQYETRVTTEMTQGIAKLTSELGKRYNSEAWVVPYSDLGYPCHPDPGCSEGSDKAFSDPHGWLMKYAQHHFKAVFVQDYYRNGIRHERFRYEVHATLTLTAFAAAIRHYLRIGAWDR
jgi:hypothetical protein